MSITMGELASRYASAAKSVQSVADSQLRTFVQAGVGMVKREIQAVHAVDTGTMLNSTSSEKVGRGEYLVGPTVDYAAYVALGTSRVAARPFHTNAAKQMIKRADSFGFSPDDLGI